MKSGFVFKVIIIFDIQNETGSVPRTRSARIVTINIIEPTVVSSSFNTKLLIFSFQSSTTLKFMKSWHQKEMAIIWHLRSMNVTREYGSLILKWSSYYLHASEVEKKKRRKKAE